MNHFVATLLSLLILGPVISLQGVNFDRQNLLPSALAEADRLACQPDSQRCQLDQRAFEAISRLHSLLDDDKNGAVDAAEAEGFAREELAYAADFERASAINREDPGVSTRELWSLWRASEPYNWTVDEVCMWTEQQVGQPEIAAVLRQLGVDGPHLPLLTEPAHQQQTPVGAAILRLLTPAQRRKLAIKAMDLVLFGPPKKAHSLLKDALLALLLVIISGGSCLVLIQRRFFEDHRLKVVDHLKIAELSVAELQQKLNSAEKQSEKVRAEKLRLEEFYKRQICGLKQERASQKPNIVAAKQEVTPDEISEDKASLINRLKQAEAEADRLRAQLDQSVSLQQPVGYCGSGGAELQQLLQLSYEIELRYCQANRLKAEEQLMKASEGLERLKRRQYSLVGLFRNALDSAEMVDYVERDIVSAKEFTEKVKLDIQDRLQRWSRIEQLIGFSIIVPEPEQGLNIRRFANRWKQQAAVGKFKRSATHSALFAKQASMSSMQGLLLRNAPNSNSNSNLLQPALLSKRCSEPIMLIPTNKLVTELCSFNVEEGSTTATAALFSLPPDGADDRAVPVPTSSGASAALQSLQSAEAPASVAGLSISQKAKMKLAQPPLQPSLESPISEPPLLEEAEEDKDVEDFNDQDESVAAVGNPSSVKSTPPASAKSGPRGFLGRWLRNYRERKRRIKAAKSRSKRTVEID